MSVANKYIVSAYAGLFEGLSSSNKLELIATLSKSLKAPKKNTKENRFYQSFGAFDSDKSAEEIIREIKAGRTFRNKEITF